MSSLSAEDVEMVQDICAKVTEADDINRLIRIHERRIAKTRSARSRKMHKLAIELLQQMREQEQAKGKRDGGDQNEG